MPKRPSPSAFWEEGYLRLTHRPLNCLVFILIPLAIYHAYALRYGTQLLAPRDVGRLLRYFGATAAVLPPLLILVVLLGQHVVHRHRWRIHPIALAGMLVESVLWVLPMLGLSYFTFRLLAAGSASQPSSFTRDVLQGLGAGIYEEFIFRLVLVGLMLLVLVHLLSLRKDLAAMVAILVGAVLFSVYHLSNEEFTAAAAFPWGALIFRMLAGVYLGGLYVCRGFGIVVGAHAAWNIWVAFVNP